MFKSLVIITTVVHMCSARALSYYSGPVPEGFFMPYDPELLLSNVESPDTLPIPEAHEHSGEDYMDVPQPLEDAHRVMTEALEDMFTRFSLDRERAAAEEMLL